MDAFGTLTRDGALATLRYERHFARPIETVWAALTVPERLADWFTAVEIEPWVGGRFTLFTERAEQNRMHGRVLAWEPPRLLEYTWQMTGEPDATVRCELEATGPSATRLLFSHSGVGYPWVGLLMPGWHVHFERLARTLDHGGAEPMSGARWRELQAEYVAHHRLEGVMLDSPPGRTS